MKPRRFDGGLWPAWVALVLLVAGCGATSVKEKAGAPVTNDAPAVAGGAAAEVTLGESSAPPVAAEAPPVQRSLRPNAPLPDEVSRVVQLVESGAGEEVVRAYVGASEARYELSLDQIIYLRDIGVSDAVIAAMMRRGSELREKDSDAATLQTNLVTAVEQIKEGLVASQGAVPNGGTAGVAPAPVTTATASEMGVPEGTPDGAMLAGSAPGATVAAPVVVQAPEAPVEAPAAVQQFYSPLATYGTWYQVPTYGWVWQPSVVTVDATWMPYRHGGRWVWSDWGWYWCSDYSWGWAPFHYGRWATYPGIGWCWVPDTVWGPSWVTWRHCDSHIGWAPLPPGCGWSTGFGLTWRGGAVGVGFGFGLTHHWYTFVPSRRFCYRNVGHHAVRGHEHDGVFRRTTVVNNVINGNNNVIVNNGIGYTEVASRVRDEIPKARVEPLPSESRTPLRADRLERGKDGFVVYRPTAVESTGGRPAPLRSEVRPVASAPSTAARSLSGTPVRPSSSSRFSGVGGSPTKSVETRGGAVPAGSAPAVSGNAVSSGRTPNTVARPAATAAPRPAAVTPSRGVARPYSATPSRVGGTQGGEARQPAVGGSAVPVPSAVPAPAAAPARPNTAVPFSSPSRTLPTRSGETLRTPVPNVARPAAPAAVGAPNGGAVLPRGGYSAPAPSVNIPRPSAPAPSAAPRLSAPARPSFSTPSPVPSVARPNVSAPAPTPNVGRPSYTAPSPSVAAPRPSYSAPVAAPAGGAPRGAYSAPAPAAASPGNGNAGRGGGRNPSN